MRKQSHFGRAVYIARRDAGHTLQQLADIAGLSQPGINRIENYARRPDVDTLRALCCCWPDKTKAARVLIEHLRDEVERAGHSDGAIRMTPAADANHNAALHCLELIQSRGDGLAIHLDALIIDLARIVNTEAATATAEAMLAAESDSATTPATNQAPAKIVRYPSAPRTSTKQDKHS